MATRAEIRALQESLNAAGFTDNTGRPLVVDGILGPRTREAIAKRDAAQGAPAPAPAAGSLDEQITALAMTQHGGVLAPFVGDTEIRALLGRYVKGEIDDATLQGLIMQTTIWRTSTGAQRAWQTLESADPASATAKVQAQSAAIMAAAREAGVTLDQTRADTLAKESLRHGWNEVQLQQAITAEFRYNEEQLRGRAADFRTQVENLATAYGLRLSDQQKGIYVTWMVQGTTDAGWTEEKFREYAKGLYPTLGDWFDQGRTLEQFADPYRQLASQTLGINPASVAWQDPKWNRALATIDTQTGQRRPMTLDEWNRTLRTDEQYGWRFTSGAMAESSSVVLNLARALGRVA